MEGTTEKERKIVWPFPPLHYLLLPDSLSWFCLALMLGANWEATEKPFSSTVIYTFLQNLVSVL